MTTTDKGWQCVPVEPTRAQIEKLATLWGYTVEEAMGVYSLILDVVGVAASKPEPDGDAGAKILCEWLGFEWDGINDGSAVAKGYRVFMYGQFGWKFEGRKGDLRDIASKIAAAPKPEPSQQAILSEIGRLIGPMAPLDPEFAAVLDDNIAALCDLEPKPEPSADLVKRARETFIKIAEELRHERDGERMWCPDSNSYPSIEEGANWLIAFAQEIAGEAVEAADENEKLRAALRDIGYAPKDGGPGPELIECISNARTALNGGE